MAMSPVKAGEVPLMGPSEDRQRAVGTPDYLAPELLLGAHTLPKFYDCQSVLSLERSNHSTSTLSQRHV